MKRTTEFVLGLIGGILGIIFSIISFIIGAVAMIFLSFAGVFLSIFALLASIAGLIGGIIVRSKPKAGGWTMIVSSIVGILCIGWFYLIPFILLLIAGIMGVVRKEVPPVSV